MIKTILEIIQFLKYILQVYFALVEQISKSKAFWFKKVFSAFNNNNNNNVKSDTLFSLTEAQEKQGQVDFIKICF